MKIMYIGCFCEPSQENYLKLNAESKISISATTFQKAFLSGFSSQQMKPNYIVNVPEIGSYPLRCKIPWIRSSEFEYNSIKGKNGGFLNLTFFKRYSIYCSVKTLSNKWAKKYAKESKIIIVYSLLYPYLKAAIDIKQKYPNTHICCIVLDLPEYFGDNPSFIHKTISKYNTSKTYSLVDNIDSFVLLTEEMKVPLKINQKPWMLLEGIYKPTTTTHVEKMHKTILYTGNLDARFGIRDLIDAFVEIEDSEFNLWICGDGTDRKYVELAAKNDSRITYWGIVDQRDVFLMQKKATLLINPRKGNAEYTKYSFPSKTMEYMASGTPTIMYSLPSLPKEYIEHVILIPNESKESLINILIEWGNKSANELETFGELAKNFINSNKNAKSQIERFINFLLKIKK